MHRLAWIVAVIAACGGGGSKPAQEPQGTISNSQPTTAAPEPTAPRTPVEEAMAKMREFRDKLCACKDAPCTEVVSNEMVKWSQEMAQKEQEPVKMTEADQKAATELGTQMGECMQRAMATGSGGGGATP